MESAENTPSADHAEILNSFINAQNSPTAPVFEKLIKSVEALDMITKVFVLEGTPHVFATSPMKYMLFREQVADRFNVGYRDVCIVGSAKLGFSPSPNKFGKPFSETSDVDVVVVSEEIFESGTRELFKHFSSKILRELNPKGQQKGKEINVKSDVIDVLSRGVRNCSFDNLDPSLLPNDNALRQEIFEKITSTSALFLALTPQVFVSKIRCRIFKSWKSAENYYTNTLRQLKYILTNSKSNSVAELGFGEPEDD